MMQAEASRRRTRLRPATLPDLYAILERNYRLEERASLRSLPYHKAPVLEFFKDREAESLTAADITAYKEWRLQQGVAKGTVNNDLRFLSSAYNRAIDSERIAKMPRIKAMRVDNARQGFLLPEAFDAFARVLESLSEPVGHLARALYALGWRTSELKDLQWSEVDTESWVLRLPAHRHKNRTPKSVPLAGDLLELFKRRLALKNGPWVFHRHGWPVKNFRDVWNHACRRTGHVGLRPHDLRRSFARNAIAAGISMKTAMEIGGWRTVATFNRYAIVDERDMREAILKLDGWSRGETEVKAVPGPEPQRAPARAGGTGEARKKGVRFVSLLKGT